VDDMMSPPDSPFSSGGGPNGLGSSAWAALSSWVEEAGWAQLSQAQDMEGDPDDPMTAFYDDPDVWPPLDSEQESWEALTARASQDGAEYEALIARLAAAGISGSRTGARSQGSRKARRRGSGRASPSTPPPPPP
jgi:hypothetical protein